MWPNLELANTWIDRYGDRDGDDSSNSRPAQTAIDAEPAEFVDLHAGPINHYWTKNIITAADGRTLYAAVGSNSNVAENGINEERGRAGIWEVDANTGEHRIFASGLRNPNGMAR